MKIERNNLILFVILLVGIVARIVKFDVNLVTDTVVYSRLGKNFIENGMYLFGENYNMGIFFPPGYPILIGILNLLFDDLFFSSRLVSFILSVGSIVLSYLIGKELYDEKAGLFAALLFSIYPVLIIVSVQGYSDASFIFFLLLSLHLFIKSIEKEGLIFYVILGIIIGVTYLIRPEALFLLLLPGLQIVGAFGSTLRFNGKYLLKFMTVCLFFVLTLSPYMIYITNYTGQFMLSGKNNISILLGEIGEDKNYHQIVNAPDNVYDQAAFSLDESKTQLAGWNRYVNPSLKDYILKDPLRFAMKYQKNLVQELKILIKLMTPFLLPLVFSFFYGALFTNRKRIIFLLLPLVFFLIYPMFIIIEKQTLMVVVFLLLFASGGFAIAQKVLLIIGRYFGVERSIFIQLSEKYIQFIMIAVLVTGSLVYMKYSSFEHHDRAHAKPEEHKRAAYYLKEKLSPEYEELNIMSKFPYVNFYSDSRFTMLPYADVPEVINFAKLYGVDYIVVDERALSGWKYYEKLKQMQEYTDGVELFYKDSSEKFIALYKVRNK